MAYRRLSTEIAYRRLSAEAFLLF